MKSLHFRLCQSTELNLYQNGAGGGQRKKYKVVLVQKEKHKLGSFWTSRLKTGGDLCYVRGKKGTQEDRKAEERGDSQKG